MPHGALYVLAGYLCWFFLNRLGIPFWAAGLLSLIMVAAIGAAIYRFLLFRIRSMTISEVIASYALGLAILEGLRWGGLKGAAFVLPVFCQGSLDIWGVTVDCQRLILAPSAAVLIGLLWLFVHHSKTGRALTAVAQDERAALTLGIDSHRMATWAMALGALLAGAAGLLILPLGSIVAESGYNVLILAVAVCILGGLGSWTGTLLASFLIGFAQILSTVFLGPHFQMVIVILVIIITLIVRPSGLLGRQGELEERV